VLRPALFADESERLMKQVSIAALIVGLTALLISHSASAQVINLGTAQNFGALAGSTVTNVGPTSVSGDVGVSPGSAITGFPPGVTPTGSLHAGDSVAGQAQSDLTLAYNAAAATACTTDLTGQDLGGLTLTPGVYCFSTSAQLTGTLTLNMQGDPNAAFLFKTGSSLTTASGSSVVVTNAGGATCPVNLNWQIGSSATIGTGSSFRGNILALTSITLTTGANLVGRALARNGAVTLDTNTIGACIAAPATCPTIVVNPAVLPNGTVGTFYGQTLTGSGGVTPYTFSIAGGSLPPGLILNGATGVISGIPTTSGSFSVTIQALDANSCPGRRAYTIAVSLGGIAGGPTLDAMGLTILVVLLAFAGVFVMNKLSL
jgi:hypothetical protein